MKNSFFRLLITFLFAAISLSMISSAVCFAADNVPVPASVSEDMFKKRDYNTSFSEYVSIDLDDPAALSGIKGVSVNGSVITLGRAGCYLLSGTLPDGKIIINADDDEKVQLVLYNVSLTSHDDTAIVVASADKVFITTAPGTQNTITSDADLMDADIDAAIYSKCDITFNGAGSLSVSCPHGHAVATKDDLRITSGKLELNAGKQGLNGKDSVRIAGGEISIRSSRDGIHSEHSKADKGFIYICGGNIDISAGRDGIYASNYITITDGQISIVSGNGTSDTTDGKKSPSCKGICSDTAITVYGGSIEVTTFDDALHSKGDINILGGNTVLSSGKEAIDGEAEVSIADGAIEIRKF